MSALVVSHIMHLSCPIVPEYTVVTVFKVNEADTVKKSNMGA
jgi:hypothetical protein